MADMKASTRSRSASPAPKQKKQKTGGFKWKESKKQTEEAPAERSYRERSPKRARSPAKPEEHVETPESATNGTETKGPATTTPSVADKFGASYKPRAAPSSSTLTQSDTTATSSEKSKEKKSKKSSTSAAKAPSGPMIIVNVNDRLGTKAAIPCLASDSVKAFKAIVAAHIGRQPHEIMLKRQGERPFKDQLSLEDYGVSSGVQLDLELDTGD